MPARHCQAEGKHYPPGTVVLDLRTPSSGQPLVGVAVTPPAGGVFVPRGLPRSRNRRRHRVPEVQDFSARTPPGTRANNPSC